MTLHRSNALWRVRVNVRIRRPRPKTPDARRLARIFGLTDGLDETLYDEFELPLAAGRIVAIVGPSGSGKSLLLRHVMRQARRGMWMDARQLVASDLPAISLLGGSSGDRADESDAHSLAGRLAVLARCGLAEPAALITPARRLSGGQVHRLALARVLWEAQLRAAGDPPSPRPVVVAADEFAASLDWPTGSVLCRHLRKLVKSSGICLLVATHRWDLLDDLQPDRVIVKPLGQPPRELPRRRWLSPSACRRWSGRWRVHRGRLADYKALGRFHYLTGPPAAHKRVYVIPAPRAHRPHGGPAIAAVAVVSPPVLQCRARNIVTGGRYCRPPRRRAVRWLNGEVETISRVIVHPIYRGEGLAVQLVRHILRTSPVAMVEALAIMGRYHPLFERAGMTAMIDDELRYAYYHHRVVGQFENGL